MKCTKCSEKIEAGNTVKIVETAEAIRSPDGDVILYRDTEQEYYHEECYDAYEKPMSTRQLLCPFCGGSSHVRSLQSRTGKIPYVRRCDSCGATGSIGFSPEDATERWKGRVK